MIPQIPYNPMYAEFQSTKFPDLMDNEYMMFPAISANNNTKDETMCEVQSWHMMKADDTGIPLYIKYV